VKLLGRLRPGRHVIKHKMQKREEHFVLHVDRVLLGPAPPENVLVPCGYVHIPRE
jgi:hypothetical protein